MQYQQKQYQQQQQQQQQQQSPQQGSMDQETGYVSGSDDEEDTTSTRLVCQVLDCCSGCCGALTHSLPIFHLVL
jgi:hypothetical protein